MTKPDAVREALAELVAAALRKAWHLGELHWQQSDSDFESQHRKADATRAKFNALVVETCAALSLSDTKPLDDPRLQQLFGDAIEGALAFGYQGENAAPPGHWLERFWHLGRAEAEKTLAATPQPMPARLNDQRIVELMRPLADDALIRPHVIAAVRAVIAEYERINGITPAQGKEQGA